MYVNDFVLLAIHAMDGKIQGKTKLQKIVYFLGNLTGQLDELGYRPHYYGPYSQEVADSVGSLKYLGFIDQNILGYSRDQRGFEVRRYDYSLTDDGMQIVNELIDSEADLWNRINAAATILRKARDLDYMKLSVAAKTFYMLGENKAKPNIDYLVEAAKHFGWKVTQSEVEEAHRFLGDLGLIEMS